MTETVTATARKSMTAVVCPRYGSADVLQLGEVEQPELTPDRVRVRVHAAGVNPLDRHMMKGLLIARLTGSGLLKPKKKLMGADFSGTIEEVGSGISTYHAGDEVFGMGPGTFAEYVCAREDRVARKPKELTHEQAASIPVAAVTALQALRDWGKLKPGQRVLINGSSGGVGTFAVQIAKAMGAEVTAVCSTANVELVKSLGADRVIDYTREDFAKEGKKYDMILENAGNRSISDCRRCLAPCGTLVLNAAPRGSLIGFAARLVKGMVVSTYSDRKVVFRLAQINPDDLKMVADLVVAGKVSPVIGREYSMREVPDAIRVIDSKHARGKLVVEI